MTKRWQLSRRTLLRGIGTTVALPMLDAMSPTSALAASKQAKPPVRMGFIYVPNGINMAEFTPTRAGDDYDLPTTLKPLAKVKSDIQVISGLALDKARSNGDGGGDHARSSGTYLTGMQARKTSGADIRVGISVDQAAATVVGKKTRLASLEIGCDRGAQAGNCDSGYSCAYSSNISWRSESTPMAKEVDPRLLFDRLFDDPEQNRASRERAKHMKYRHSVLDYVREDANRLKKELGVNDNQKLDEYLQALREIEQRIQKSEMQEKQAFKPKLARPDGIPREYSDHMRLMGDLMVLAWQADVTRVTTFMFANAGSNRTFKNVGVSEGHHYLSHHRNNKSKMDKIAKIDRFYVEQYAYIVERLKSIKEGSGTLLDNVMLQFGSGISDGNRHRHNDLPIILAGRGGGSLTTGRHVRFPRETPLCNLYLSLLDRMGASRDSLGDSTGRLKNL